MRGYDFKGFYLPELLKECNELPTLKDQIDYLETALEEWEINPPELDLNGEIDPPFEKRLQIEINRRRRNIEITEINKNEKMGFSNDDRIKLPAQGITDIVRIFENMKDADIIDRNTKVTQIAQIFDIEKEKFTSSYYSIRSELKSYQADSNSEKLLRFIKKLIETSYKKRENVRDELIEFIEKM
jgi:hypothetical protein